ncbi:MAG: methyltransferase domain-containing protein [Desulfopila sp.]|jgi:malonyl-CoA O-methyltransferase|nr:methyltransferase domain-containing protein [Desulfopila sp.]
MDKLQTVNKEKIARSFLRGKTTYDLHADIQRGVGRRLVEKLTSYPSVRYGKVLEIGCCTGGLTEMLLDTHPVEKLYLNDLVPDFYDDVIRRLGDRSEVEIVGMFGDIERLAFPSELDLVISSATFQWLTDLSSLFGKIASSLHSQGLLVFSIFGPGTLMEFKTVTGIGLEYKTVGTLLDMLGEHFDIEEEESIREQLFFTSPREVLRHLQATGVGGVREHRWTPSALREFEKKYVEKFGGESGVPVTYMSSYIVASKKG